MSDVVTGHSRCMAVADGKGGVGKTSVTANVAGLVAAADYRVLAISLDPQDNLGEDLGYAYVDLGDDGANLVAAMRGESPLEPLREVRPRLDVACGGSLVEDLVQDLYVKRSEGQEYATDLAAALTPIAADYDLILIDCPPGYSVLQHVALVASKWILIPTQADASSRKGISLLAERVNEASVDNPDLGLLGVVLFDVPANATRVLREAAASIAADLGDDHAVLPTSVRTAPAAARAGRERGQLMHEMATALEEEPKWWQRRQKNLPASGLADSARTVAKDYQDLAEEILRRLVEQETS